jgi:glycosyltransferase involved in cell wall biosynthesis
VSYNLNSGPELFLSRLTAELKKDNSSLPFEIFNPTNLSLKKIKVESRFKVGRFDGAYFYNFSYLNTKNFLKLKGRKNFSFLSFNAKYFNKQINDYLNRNSYELLSNVDLIVYQSKLSKEMQEKFVRKSNKPSEIINNGVPLDLFYPTKKKIDKGLNFVITAKFRPHKRLFDAILLINEIQKIIPKSRLKIIGEIDPITLAAIKNIDLTYCDFIGELMPEKLTEVYSICHIGLSPAIFDPCPNSVVEMMACGIPVITCKESGASELIQIESLCISEQLKLDYLEFQTIEKLPKINLKSWVETVLDLIDNYYIIQDEILNIVESRLDIRIVAQKYKRFIMQNLKQNN